MGEREGGMREFDSTSKSNTPPYPVSESTFQLLSSLPPPDPRLPLKSPSHPPPHLCIVQFHNDTKYLAFHTNQRSLFAPLRSAYVHTRMLSWRFLPCNPPAVTPLTRCLSLPHPPLSGLSPHSAP